MALTLPAAAALTCHALLPDRRLVARAAPFTHADALQTAQALFHYGWGVPAFVLIRVLQPAFFARQDTKSPMRFGLISVAVNIVLGISLFHVIGFPGIAAATAIAAWLNVAQMVVVLRQRRLPAQRHRPGRSSPAMALASAVMGGRAGAGRPLPPAARGAAGPLPRHRHRRQGAGVVSLCALGGLAYPLLLFAFGGGHPGRDQRASCAAASPPPRTLPTPLPWPIEPAMAACGRRTWRWRAAAI